MRPRPARDLPMSIGAHAVSRVSYDLPEGFRGLEAKIGCNQEVWAN